MVSLIAALTIACYCPLDYGSQKYPAGLQGVPGGWYKNRYPPKGCKPPTNMVAPVPVLAYAYKGSYGGIVYGGNGYSMISCKPDLTDTRYTYYYTLENGIWYSDVKYGDYPQRVFIIEVTR